LSIEAIPLVNCDAPHMFGVYPLVP
jgi:hypothetical protein